MLEPSGSEPEAVLRTEAGIMENTMYVLIIMCCGGSEPFGKTDVLLVDWKQSQEILIPDSGFFLLSYPQVEKHVRLT